MTRRLSALTLALGLVVGGVAGATPATDLWESARASFEQALYPAASETLRLLLRDYPEDPLTDDADYLLALCRVYTGAYDPAARALEQFPRRYPGSQYLRLTSYWLGYSRYRLGQAREAIAAFRAQVDGYPAERAYRLQSLSFLAELYERSGSSDLALTASRELAASGEGGELVARALYRMGGILAARGDAAGSLEAYARIRLGHPTSSVAPRSLYHEAVALAAAGQRAESQLRFTEYLAATAADRAAEGELRRTAHLELARAAAAAGDPAAVLERLARLESEDAGAGRLEEVHALRAEARFDLGDLQGARASYRSALELTRDAAGRQRFTYNIAVCSAALGDSASALAGLAEAERGPDPLIAARSRYRMAVIHSGSGDAEKAIALLERITGPGDAEEEPLRLLGELLDRREDHARALGVWAELARRFSTSPLWPRYLYRMGNASLGLADHAAALDAFNRVIRACQGRADLAALEAEARYAIGFVYSARGEYIRSLPYFREAASSAAADDELRGRSRYAQAVAAYNTESYDAASAAFREYIAKAPGGAAAAPAWLGLGKSELRAGRLPSAEEAFQTASVLPGDGTSAAESLYWLGVTRTQAGKTAEAEASFVELARDHPRDARAAEGWLRSGVLARLRGEQGESLARLDRALEGAAAGSAVREEAMYERALTLLALDRPVDARRGINQLAREYSVSPLVPEALLRVAQSSYQAGRYRSAAGEFADVARAYPSSDAAGPALYWSAESWLMAGEAERAVAGYWDYAKRQPDGSYSASAEAGVVKALGEDPPEALLERVFDLAMRDTGAPPALANRVRLIYASVLWARGRVERSIEVARSITLEDLAEPHRGQAVLLGARHDRWAGRLERAVAVLTALSASRTDRVGAEALLELGLCLGEQGRGQEAVAQLVRLPVLYPQHRDLAPPALAAARDILAGVGDQDGAERLSARLADEYPEYEPR